MYALRTPSGHALICSRRYNTSECGAIPKHQVLWAHCGCLPQSASVHGKHRASGVIGSRAGFRFLFLRECGFKSHLAHTTQPYFHDKLSQYCLSVCPHIAHNIAAYPGGRIRTPDKPALHCLDNETPLHRSIRQNPISSPTPSQILHFPIVYPTYTLHTPTGYCSSVKTTVFHGTSPSAQYEARVSHPPNPRCRRHARNTRDGG